MKFHPADRRAAEAVERFMVRDRVTGRRYHAMRIKSPVVLGGFLLPSDSIVVSRPIALMEGEHSPSCDCCGEEATQRLILYMRETGVAKFHADYQCIT